jgi:hypothetical protein
MTCWRFLGVVLLLSGASLAQTTEVSAKPLTDADIQLLRQDLQKEKDQIIGHTMNFSGAEAAAFWPLYKSFSAEQQSIAAKRMDVILEYAKNFQTLDDAKAHDLSQRMLTVDDETQSLRKKYYPKFEKAIGAKRAAKFYQVDNRLHLAVGYQLASEIPIIP